MAVHPGHAKQSSREEFEAWAVGYDHSPMQWFLFGPSYRTLLSELVRWERTRESFDLLDVGCGTGTFAAMVFGAGLPARIVGLDYAASMCRMAHQKACAAGATDRLRFLNGDSEHLPFAAGSFDVITCSNSFHHYPHQDHAVKEMYRVLRPGGRLVILDGFRDNLIGWFIFDVVVGRLVEKHIWHVTWRRMREYFEAAGFERVRQRKLNLLFPLLATVGVKPKGPEVRGQGPGNDIGKTREKNGEGLGDSSNSGRGLNKGACRV
jgi:ubiquinone/menaquinone biosynthesis C-methylase UbiE